MSKEVAWRSSLLGSCCALGLLGLGLGPSYLYGGSTHLSILSFFHYSEYLVTAISNPKTLKLKSFLLDNTYEYWLAALLGWMEYFGELWLFPGLKLNPIPWYLGLVLCGGGELLRKAAMLNAGHNFTHQIQMYHQPGHVLVTSGVYSLCRHPSYVGWFYWSIGTQMILCNPICTVGYAVVSWMFFRNRVEGEEIVLINFFREDYVRYQEKVPTGLPFIHGYRLAC
ncbi:ICMT [Cordylochernes scorpioides]|uniref:Protein-S-isoprenylcysteine O-methyltransferase n=1 Tax=Cordylochernes scorpioides TaxID=51811 RepID=A0ABY6LLD3_9ARAC|nr:ICMT [Cordylochernes scorpioides]